MFDLLLDAYVKYAKVFYKRLIAAGLSCAVVMTKGNILAAFSFGHLFTAFKTGIVSAIVILLASIFGEKYFAIDEIKYHQAYLVGVGTAVADFAIHTPTFFLEPVVTGLLAIGITWIISKAMSKVCQCN